MTENKFGLNYPRAVSLVAFVAFVIVAFAQYERVFPAYKNIFVNLRAFYIFGGLGFLIYFFVRPFNDLVGSLFSIFLLSYSLTMIWLMPSYESSYFQIAVGTAFFPFRRSWIHPVIFGIGLIGMIACFAIQERMHWILPDTAVVDFMASVTLFFFLAWTIQKFSISVYQNDADNLRRFGAIGRDAARLTHDLKGLLSSPLLILEALKNSSTPLSAESYERSIALLQQDMAHIQDTLQGINRLAILNDKADPVCVNETISGVLKILERRLNGIEVTLPAERHILANADRLHSMFFNILINAIQAFERNAQGVSRKLEIFWESHTLVFKDNAGGVQPLQGRVSSSGLGLELIRSDARAMGAQFLIRSEGKNTQAQIKFNKKSMLAVKNKNHVPERI